MLKNHMGNIIKTQIKITSSKSVKPTKNVINFYLKKRMRRCLQFHKNFLVILLENDGGNGGGVEVPMREDVRVERSV